MLTRGLTADRYDRTGLPFRTTRFSDDGTGGRVLGQAMPGSGMDFELFGQGLKWVVIGSLVVKRASGESQGMNISMR